MVNSNTNVAPAVAPEWHKRSLLCWKSVAAGLVISIFSYMILAALGAGIVGSAAQHAIEREHNGSALATESGLWMGLAAVISLFLGSYFSVRIARSKTNKVGVAHGFVIASLFFIFLIWEASNGLGVVASGFGSLIEGMGKSVANVASSSQFQDTLNSALGTATLKSDPKVVAEGLGVRLLQGDAESTKSYFAYQTGLTGAELDSKVAQLKAGFDRAAKEIGEKTARAVSDTGWSLFVTFLVGLLGAFVGGRIGAHSNNARPLAASEEKFAARAGVLANHNGSVVPYIFGWLLGVPTSILFLIFILRSIF